MLEYNVSGGVFLIFYADVYFLINFTVDFLALHFATRVSKVKSSALRMTLISVLGALLAVFEVILLSGFLLTLALSILMLLTVMFFVAGDIHRSRRIKCAVAFFVSEALIGGTVSFGYTLLDKYFYPQIRNTEMTSPNRRLLILSVMILLSVGVFKLVALLFSHTEAQRNVNVQIEFMGRAISTEALVDTGNLLKDPSTLRPVMLIKYKQAEQLAPDIPKSIDDVLSSDVRYVKRLCIIPAKYAGGGRMLVGFRPDKITVMTTCNSEKITVDAVIAIDTEGGSYGGFFALMPAAVFN